MLHLSLDGEGPLHRQLYRALRRAILDGAFPAGARLPASRVLAGDLALARNTVLQAFEQLLDEGYVAARTGSGTYVADSLPDDRVAVARDGARVGTGPSARSPLRLSRLAERVAAAAPPGGVSWRIGRKTRLYDFRYGEPSYADLPLATWWRLHGRRARRVSARRLGYGAPGGAPELRRALAAYLRRARGVVCEPRQVIVVRGTQQAIDLAMRVVVDPGERVVVEEPRYPGLSLSAAAAGAELVSVAVDAGGLRVADLAAAGAARLICVTPSHQFPTGVIMPLARRLELLALAARTGAFVLEDDYDSEFRFDGRPVESLQGLDRAGRVLYAGTASKLLFPALRLGWLVVPPDLVEPFESVRALADTGTATLDELVLADFIEGGHLERHVRRARVRNGARRAALLAALARHLGARARVSGTDAGLHVLVWLPEIPAARAAALRREAAARDVGVYPVTPYYAHPPTAAGLVLGYAALTERAIEEGIARLAEAYDAVAGAGGDGKRAPRREQRVGGPSSSIRRRDKPR